MPSEVYRYEFSASVPMEEVESSMLLSIVGVQSLHGETTVQLSVAHAIDFQGSVPSPSSDT